MPEVQSFSAKEIEGILHDYYVAYLSRQVSLIGRKEVLNGKAKFGIFGDGKEVAQVAMARQFRDGDWRSGYYRDQTFMIYAGLYSAEEFFHQLYGLTDVTKNKSHGGRSFNNHFSTPNMNADGSDMDLMAQKNSCADLSPTAAQMPRLIGLAYTSKLFRLLPDLQEFTELSNKGNEVAFGMIGDASTSEGHFFETINAAAVLQVPMALAVWDDGFGISVPRKLQTTKDSISDALRGFERTKDQDGILIYKAKGWDYWALRTMFEEGIAICRRDHIPVLFHVEEMTQPMGHSTSGSHERYKTPERLQWERDYDPIVQMRAWLLKAGVATESEIVAVEKRAEDEGKRARLSAWQLYQMPIRKDRDELVRIVGSKSCVCTTDKVDKVGQIVQELKAIANPIKRDNLSAAKRILTYICRTCSMREALQKDLNQYIRKHTDDNFKKYSTDIHNESPRGAIRVKPVAAKFSANPTMVAGREILRDNFDALLEKYPKLIVFGEDTGFIGGVNQTYEGLQKKHGNLRVSDTGIRELTIIGQGIGMALRGLRPIAEIQYLDYLLYALQPMSDDLATTHWRSVGQQKIPLIVSTRGHRLEGIWHSGSPMSMIINSIRGVYVCVPRNMTQAAGMYNTLLEGEDTALVIESLNGYRLREPRPENIGEFKVPLGVPEVLTQGSDVTLVTYGSCVRIAQEAVKHLSDFGISVELIDVQTLLPFDLGHTIVESIKKTNKVLFFDEDVPGGASAYMMQKVIEEQDAYLYLDAKPRTLAAKEHRPAYSSDGDYFSNPSADDVFEMIYGMMHEYKPEKYRGLFE